MNLVTRAFTIIALFAGVTAQAQKPTQRFLQSLLRNNDLTGIQVAFIKDGKTQLYQGGLAREGSIKPMTATTLFHAGSLGKTVFAYAVMQLVDRGSIALDTPLLHYLGKYDRFVKGDVRYGRITARMVLSHTLGLADSRCMSLKGRSNFWQNQVRPGHTLAKVIGFCRKRWKRSPGSRLKI